MRFRSNNLYLILKYFLCMYVQKELNSKTKKKVNAFEDSVPFQNVGKITIIFK